MKKRLTIAACLVLTVVLLAACGSRTAQGTPVQTAAPGPATPDPGQKEGD